MSYNITQLSEFVGVTTRTIRTWMMEGKIPEPSKRSATGVRRWTSEEARVVLDYRIMHLPSTIAEDRRIPK